MALLRRFLESCTSTHLWKATGAVRWCPGSQHGAMARSRRSGWRQSHAKFRQDDSEATRVMLSNPIAVDPTGIEGLRSGKKCNARPTAKRCGFDHQHHARFAEKLPDLEEREWECALYSTAERYESFTWNKRRIVRFKLGVLRVLSSRESCWTIRVRIIVGYLRWPEQFVCIGVESA